MVMDSNRIFRPLLWLLVLAGAFFGLAATIAPSTFAEITGFKGTDLFTYRLAGAATFAYAIGLASIAFTAGTWQLLREPPLAVAGKARAELERPIAQWLVVLYVIGVVAA